MLVLDTTTKSIKVAMSAAAATTNPDFVSTYADNDGTTFVEGASDGTLNGTTSVTLVASPAASTRRTIKSIYIENKDTSPVTITVSYNNNGTLRTIAKVTLAVGDTWSTDGTTDTNGNFKTIASATGITSLGSIQVFTSSGTYTKPAALVRAKITVIGAGGGGGYGGGGGGGGAAIRLMDASSISATVSVTIGTGGTSANPGNTGGTSSFGGYCSATGGSGGRYAGGVYPGRGGNGTGGTINLEGQGAGGIIGLTGGCSFMGGGGPGPDTDGTYSHGGSGGNYGGGGGGSYGTSDYGGSGANGVVMVEEFYS
jgi:hypothetical protein